MEPTTAPLTLHPPKRSTERQRLTTQVKMLAAKHGLSVNAVTTADPFPAVADHLEQHIADGHVEGMDYASAHHLSLLLIVTAFVMLVCIYALNKRFKIVGVAP